MNAKEELLSILNTRLKYLKEALEHNISIDPEVCKQNINKTEQLITAVENAIFEIPKISSAAPEIDSYNEVVQYLRNYKKTESDGKD